MIREDVLLNMIATEAIEGGAVDHYFDEFRNREFIPHMPIPESPRIKSELPPVRYDLECIQQPDGSYRWTEFTQR